MNTPPTYHSIRFKELIALLVFFVVGCVFALPSLSVSGAIAGQYKMVFFLLVFIRLAWSVYMRRFNPSDYSVYFVIAVLFCG
jgi:hypothetical protein